MVQGYGANQVVSAGPANPVAVTPVAYQPGPFQGLLNGGQSRAVAGARVYMLEANSLAPGSPSISLLSDATGTPGDSIGHYVLTDEHGGVSIAGHTPAIPDARYTRMLAGATAAMTAQTRPLE